MRAVLANIVVCTQRKHLQIFDTDGSNKDVFSSYKSLNRVIGQSSKEGTSFTVLGTGNVELRVVFKGSKHTLMFHDALHALDITENLLSISRMDITGWSAVFGDRHV
jgi:hypothetical protein